MAQKEKRMKNRKKKKIIKAKKYKQLDRTLSDLPEPIIHHIMSFLPTSEATKVSTLSKKFLCVWRSFPILDFDFGLFTKTKPVTIPVKRPNKKKELFLTFVHESLQGRWLNDIDSSCTLEKLRFVAPLYAFESDIRVSEMLNYALKNKVKELNLDGQYFDLIVYPTYCFTVDHEILSANFIKVLNLRGFCLHGYDGDDDVFLNFASVEDFTLKDCNGFTSIKLSGPKLRAAKLDSCNGLEEIHIDTTRSFESLYFGGSYDKCVISVSSCEFLKCLVLRSLNFIDEFGVDQSNSNGFCCLEKLEIQCGRYSYFKNCAYLFFENLKSLKLTSFPSGTKVAILEAPNLVWFSYNGSPKSKIRLGNSSEKLEVELLFKNQEYKHEESYCNRLKNLMRSFRHSQTLTLKCVSDKQLVFRKENRKDCLDPTIIYNIKHLKIWIDSKERKTVELVDSLLWLLPHPNVISITVNDSPEVKIMKFKYHTHVEESLSSSVGCKTCWRRNIKEITLENFDDSSELTSLQTFFSGVIFQIN